MRLFVPGPAQGVALQPRRGAPYPTTLPAPALGLDLGLAALTVEAVSAGPVWKGTHGLRMDASVHAVGPLVDLSGSFETLAWTSIPSALTLHMICAYGPGNLFMSTRRYTTSLFGIGDADSVSRAAFTADAGTGLGMFSGRAVRAGGYQQPFASFNGGTEGTDTPASPIGTQTLIVGARRYGVNGSVAPSQAGGIVREVAIWVGSNNSAGDRTAAYGTGTPADVQTLIATSPTHYYDMSNFYDSGGGVWKVRDLIDTSGASDLTIVGGDDGDFVEV